MSTDETYQTSVAAQEVVIVDWSGLGECVELADPLARDEERHEALLRLSHQLLSCLPQRLHLIVLFPDR